MHWVCESGGSFGIEYQIIKIIYSSLISIVINKILGLLSLSNDAVIKFKENKNKNGIDKRKKGLMKNLNIKFVFGIILQCLELFIEILK